MSKPFKFFTKDPNAKCKNCGKPIKANVTARKEPQNYELCYKCYLAERRHRR